MKRLSLIFLFLISHSLVANAQTSDGSIDIRGLGTIGCGEYMRWVDTGNINQINFVNQWVWGFNAAYQFRGELIKPLTTPKHRNISSPDSSTIQLYLKRHCSNSPLSTVLNGTLLMTKELAGIGN